MKQKIILVFKTHFDIGFTDLAEKVIQKISGSMCDEVLEACGNTADMGKLRYVWTMPAWPMQVMQQADGGRAERLKEFIQNGQAAWHALPFTSHFDFCGLEDFIRGLRYGRALSAEHDKPLAISAKLTDVPGHGAMLPAVLAGAGIRFLHLGCNEYPWPPDVPELFFWESPDGSRVLTMYNKSYGSCLKPPADWPFPVWMALMHTQDNCGPQSAEAVRALAKEAQQLCPQADIVSGTLDDFYRALSACNLSGLPVVRKDLADTWIHGVGSYPAEVSMVRQVRRDLRQASMTAALCGKVCADLDHVTQAMCSAYDRLVLFGEHTWGLDVKTWIPHRVYEKTAFLQAKKTEAYQYMESSWKEQADRAREARQYADQALALSATDALSLVNPSGSAFTGWVPFPHPGKTALMNGIPCPAEQVGGETRVFLQDLPPMSVCPVTATEKANPPPLLQTENGTACSVENHRYRLEYNSATGVIQRLWDKTLNTALLEEADGQGVFSYRYDRYGKADVEKYLDDLCCADSDWGRKDNGREDYPDCARETFFPAFIGCQTDGRTIVFRFTGTAVDLYGDAEEIVLRITLPEAGDALFVTLDLNNKQETPYIESASFVMPLAMQNPHYLINKNGCVIDPASDIVDCANHTFYCLEDFAAAQEDAGLFVIAKDTPLLSMGETGIYTYRKQYEEHRPHFYFNLFNNMWGTNFPQWMGGNFSFSFTLFGCASVLPQLSRAADLAEGPFFAQTALPDFPLILPEHMRVLGMEPCENGFLLRFRDTSGMARDAVFACKNTPLTFCEADLQNRPIGARHPGEIQLSLSPWSIRTLLCLSE